MILEIIFFGVVGGLALFIGGKVWNKIQEKHEDDPAVTPDIEDDGSEEPDPIGDETDIGEADGEGPDSDNPPQ